MADAHATHHPPAEDDNSIFSVSRLLTGLAIGAGVLGAGIILAPHVLPSLGVTSPSLAQEAALMIHNTPTGMAGAINNTLGLIPGIGERLAAGGFFTAGASALTGIGGSLLSQFIESKEDGSKNVRWSNVIKYGALITSAIIAMPAILTAIGTGIMYMGIALSDYGIIAAGTSNSIISGISQTMGGVGGTYIHNMLGLEGIGAVIPHFLSCGAPFAPALLTFVNPLKQHEMASPAPGLAVTRDVADDGLIADIQLQNPLEAGKPCQALLNLKRKNGKALSAQELAVMHTEKLHLLLADSSLKDYHHIHPQATNEPGVFAFTFTPATSHRYSAWVDCMLAENGRPQQLKSDMAPQTGRFIPPSIHSNSSAEQNGLRFEWQSEPLQKGKDSIITLNVTDAQGNPTRDLEPVMGAYAHLAGFSADGNSLIHSHPLGDEPTHDTQRGGPSLRFHIKPDSAGPTQFFLQVKHKGENIYVPFGQQVKQPALATERLADAHAAMGHGR